MTLDEFKEKFDRQRRKIVCRTPAERNEALQFLDDLGYILTEASRTHVEKNDWLDSSIFLFPGLVRNDGCDMVGCYATAYANRIEFDEIIDLIDGEGQIDEEEVEKALFEVLSRM